MFSRKYWMPTPREIIAGIISGVIIMILAAVAAYLANPPSDADVVGWFLYAALVLSSVWVLSGIGTVLWRRLLSQDAARATSAVNSEQASASIATKKTKCVEFRFPSNWDSYFKWVEPTTDHGGNRLYAEEARVFVHVLRRIQNAKFELLAAKRRGNGWETVARMGSSELTGVVHGETTFNFVVMRRSFLMVPAQYDDIFGHGKQGVEIRVEKDAVMLPDAPKPFATDLDCEFRIEVRVAHDDQPNNQPETASFVLHLHKRVESPQTRIFDRKNIEPIASGQPNEPSGTPQPRH
jgi:hypothetical protein